MISLGLIGPGRVGKTLAGLLSQDKVKLGPVLSRNITSARRAVRVMKTGVATKDVRRLNDTDVVLITVPDGALEKVVTRLRKAKVDYRDKVILHTSLAYDSEVLAPLKEQGAAVGGLYPLYVFQSPVLTLSGVYFACEGERVAVAAARQIVRELGAEFQLVKSRQKVNHIVAASIVSDLMTGLLECSMGQMTAGGFTRRRGLAAISRLVEATIAEYAKSGRRSCPGPLLGRAKGPKEAVVSESQTLDPRTAEYYRYVAYQTLRVLGRDKEASQFLNEN